MTPRRALLVLALASLILAGAASADAPRRHAVDAGGFNVTVWERSGRQPRMSILLVHGRTWSALPNFHLDVPGERRSIMDALADSGYAAYAIDLRGYGATARDDTGWLSPQRAADDVTAVLRWISNHRPLARPPALLGYSRGAHVSLLVAQQHPDLLSSLVLFGLPPIERPAPLEPPPDPRDVPPHARLPRKTSSRLERHRAR